MAKIIRTSEDIDAADKLELRVMDLETGEVNRYHSMVQEITRAGIAVSMPTDGRMTVPLQEGTLLVVSIWKGHADHRFKSRVLKRKGGRIPMLVLEKPAPEDISRTPRRKFFRVETRIPAKLHVQGAEKKAPLEGIIRDLSASGCRLQTFEHVPSEAPVALDLDLPFPPDGEGFDRAKPLRQVPGTVRSSVPVPETGLSSPGGRRAYLIGIEVGSLDNITQSLLLRYVAFRQRELIQEMSGEAEARSRGRPQSPPPEQASLAKAEEDLRKTEDQIYDLEADAPDAPPSAGGVSPDPDGAADAIDGRVADEGGAPPVSEAPSGPAGGPAETDRQGTHAQKPSLGGASDKPRGKAILVVDDEPGIRDIMTQILSGDGFRVLEARDGQEAMDVARSVHVDLVITDLMMPRMNGWRLLTSLREHGLDVPVVIVTAYMAREGQEVLTNKDVAGFLTKPIKLDELLRMVNGILFPAVLSRKKRILAVDDEEDMRLLSSAVLQKAGFEVETAFDGHDALRKVVHFRPDLVLLDIMMPKMDGFEVCERLRSIPATADLPVMMLTVKTSPDYVRRALSLKVSGYIVKPFEAEDLINRIRKATGPA